jgi:hypothetical protein
MRRLILVLCLTLATGVAQGQKIYKYVLPDGKVVYSDTPPPDAGAEKVELSPLQTFSAPPAAPLGSGDREKKKEGESYEEFTITKPANDETIRDNGGNISISLSLKPGLKGGHSIDVTMDGKSLGSGRGTSITLTDVDRGSHSVQATVKDESGKAVAKSNSVTFHLKRGGV